MLIRFSVRFCHFEASKFNNGVCFCCSQWPDPAYRVAPPQLPLDSVIEDDERLMFDMDQHLRHCHCDCGHDGYEGSLRHKVSTNHNLDFHFNLEHNGTLDTNWYRYIN